MKTCLGIYFEELHDTDNIDAPPGDIPAILNAGATVIKIGGSASKAEEIARRWPNVLVVYRDLTYLEEVMGGWKPENGVDYTNAVLHWMQAFKARVSPAMRKLPNIRYSGAFCEWGDWAHLEWFAAFEAERVRQLAAIGCKTVIGAFSAEARLWEPSAGEVKTKLERFRTALDAALANDAWLELHFYNGPALRDKGILGNDDQDFMFSYRAIRQHEAARGRKCPNIFGGELGEDIIIYPSIDPNNPAKNYHGYRAAGYDRAGYTDALLSVASEMTEDGVKGATVFYDHRRGDDEYNISFGSSKPKDNDQSVAMRLADAVYALPDIGTPAPPVPDPEPPPVTPPSGPSTAFVKVVNVRSYLNCRSGPSTSYSIIGTLPKGLVFEVETPYNSWAKVAGVAGYVSAAYIQSA